MGGADFALFEVCASSWDLVFPNGNGKPDGHFLRRLKAIAKKAAVEGAELHRYRKTYADTLHEEGVSVNIKPSTPGRWM